LLACGKEILFKLKIMNMKLNVTSKVHVDEKLLHEIRTQVKETLAVDVDEVKSERIFSVADMWNIHKQKRQRTTRRFF
jgi:hypothetical protein